MGCSAYCGRRAATHTVLLSAPRWHEDGRGRLAVYELTVVKRHGDVEIRYTDLQPHVGETVRIDGRAARVVSRHEDPSNENAVARFVCALADCDVSGAAGDSVV